jgi:predicted LPLAT superfamily acyltransferase
LKQEWLERPEAGSVLGYKLISGFARICGRPAARLVLVFIVLFFLARRGPERRASRAYLKRVLTRRPTLFDVARHFYYFAAATLDRVFMLSEKFKRFDVQVFGLDELRRAWGRKRGVLIFGSHLGSFDALRVLAQFRQDVKVRVVIDLEQNPELSKVLNVLNPSLALSVINARQDGTTTALAIREALDDAALVTMLVERARPGNPVIATEFLGEPAPFPTSPWLLAATLKAPVILCFGLHRGGNRYDLYFEPFADPVVISRANRQGDLTEIIRRYADRLAHHARLAPYNWFNFYDFWQTHDRSAPARAHGDDAPADSGALSRR